MVSAEGGSPEQLTADERNHGSGSWSPDGNSLAFGDHQTDNVAAIHILDLRTRRVSTVPGSEGLTTVRWSPDGRYLAAKTSDNSKLMGFDFKTGKWTDDDLNKFVANPKGFIPGTAMGFAGIPKDSERADVIAYLHTLADKPVPLPTAAK